MNMFLDKISEKEVAIARMALYKAIVEFDKNCSKDEIGNFLWIPKNYEYSSWLIWLCMQKDISYKLYNGSVILLQDARNVKK